MVAGDGLQRETIYRFKVKQMLRGKQQMLRDKQVNAPGTLIDDASSIRTERRPDVGSSRQSARADGLRPRVPCLAALQSLRARFGER